MLSKDAWGGLGAVSVFKAGAAVPAVVFSSLEVKKKKKKSDVSQLAVGERGFHQWGSLSQMHYVDWAQQDALSLSLSLLVSATMRIENAFQLVCTSAVYVLKLISVNMILQ